LQKMILVLAATLLFAGTALGADFVDEVGRKVSLEGMPRRIVSVAPNVTEILFALGLGERVVGVSTYCQFPPEAQKKEKIGGYINPSLEKIIALRPDLVIGAAEGDLKNFVERLAALGIPVYIINPQDVAGVTHSIENIGAVTFQAQGAERMAGAMRAQIQAIQKRIQGLPRPRVLHVLSVDPLISAGKKTFVNDLIRLSGGRNIAEKATARYPRFSMEEIIRQDPEIIILSSMRSQDPMKADRKWWDRWQNIAAVRFGRIYVLDADLIHRPSPRIVQGLEKMARVIHPEAFQ
jgi:iron complex transport system substrate-binding protein